MPESRFELTITTNETGEVVSRTLHCQPTGGTHPHPAEACEQLSKVDGHIEKIPEDPGACPEIVFPKGITFRAEGTWNGHPRHYEATFGNACFGNRATGGVVFDF